MVSLEFMDFGAFLGLDHFCASNRFGYVFGPSTQEVSGGHKDRRFCNRFVSGIWSLHDLLKTGAIGKPRRRFAANGRSFVVGRRGSRLWGDFVWRSAFSNWWFGLVVWWLRAGFLDPLQEARVPIQTTN